MCLDWFVHKYISLISCHWLLFTAHYLTVIDWLQLLKLTHIHEALIIFSNFLQHHLCSQRRKDGAGQRRLCWWCNFETWLKRSYFSFLLFYYVVFNYGSRAGGFLVLPPPAASLWPPDRVSHWKCVLGNRIQRVSLHCLFISLSV